MGGGGIAPAQRFVANRVGDRPPNDPLATRENQLVPSSLNELAAALVAIDSVNPALVPGGAGERQIASFVADWCAKQGLDVEILGTERPSVVATKRGSGGGRSLLLNGHLDTVGVSGMEAPFNPRVEDGRLYGRGAYDMKGALAAMLLAATEATALRGDVIVTLVADEELASIGTEAVVQQVHADAAIVAEPTDLRVAIAHRGFVGFELETAGVAAHGSRPDLGVDAIAKMGPILVALAELDEQLQAGSRHPLVGPASLHASLIVGGQELSSFPASCVLTGERRTIPGETVAQVEQELRAIAGDAALRIIASRDPLTPEPDHPFVELVGRIAEAGEYVGALFWTDAALIADTGIPTVLFGPAGEGAHARVEWVDLASLDRVREVVGRVAAEWCA
jgi:acetylornithine deacetylase